MQAEGIVAVLIKTASLGLSPASHIGLDLQSMRAHLFALADQHGCNPCGEGGEYETLVIDCPLFRRHIVLDDCTIAGDNLDDPVCPVGHLCVRRWHTEPKSEDELDAIKLFTKPNGFSPVNEPVGQVPSSRRQLAVSPVSDPFPFASTVVQSDTAVGLFQSMNEALERGSIPIGDVYFISLALRDMKSFAELNEAYAKAFGAVNPPTRCCVEMALPDNVFGRMELLHAPVKRDVLHVQSVSQWAPSCIGPYSQASRVGDLLFLAGSIALVPERMVLHGGDHASQARLCLDHCLSVLRTFRAGFHNVLRCTVYVVPDRADAVEAVDAVLQDKSFPQVLYVPVRALPRDARVEIALVAHMNPPITAVPVSGAQVHLAGHEDTGARSLSMLAPASGDPLDLDAAFASVSGALALHGMSWSDCVSLQIHHCLEDETGLRNAAPQVTLWPSIGALTVGEPAVRAPLAIAALFAQR